jgi:predicted TIM-barrel fold metal-dependent hydrolase
LHVWSADWPYAAGQAPGTALDGDARVGSAEALLRRMDDAGVGRALIVQPITYKFDHAYVAHCLAAWPRRFRGMALADPSLAPAEAVASLRAVVAAGSFAPDGDSSSSDSSSSGGGSSSLWTGVRFNPYLWPGGECRMADATGHALFEEAGRLGLAVGFMTFKGLLPLADDIEALLGRFPGTAAVLDHWGFFHQPAGRAAAAGGAADEEAWARLLAMGRRFPQLHVKLSALFRVTSLGAAAAAGQAGQDADTDTETDTDTADAADANYADLRPRLAALLGAFGADRLMWGSDFPYVVLEAGGYNGSKAALEAMLGELGVGEADAAMVLGGTAQKLFFAR